jgi:hypothetical protein
MVARQEVVSNSESVEVGNFETNQLDISDVQQFDKAGKGGASSEGTLIHETIEQLDKAIAEKAIKEGIDKSGEQARRLNTIEAVLK